MNKKLKIFLLITSIVIFLTAVSSLDIFLNNYYKNLYANNTELCVHNKLTSKIKNEYYDEFEKLVCYDVVIICDECGEEIYTHSVHNNSGTYESIENYTETKQEDDSTLIEYDIVNYCIDCGRVCSIEHKTEVVEYTPTEGEESINNIVESSTI